MRPSAQACVSSENSVAAPTKAIASGPALSWIFFHRPVWYSACSGSEEPAMNPAMQANPCSARTSELRNRMRPTD